MSRSPRADDVEAIISEVARTRGTTLDLFQMDLAELPDEIRRLTWLTDLEVSGNALTGLPDWIGELDSLRKLSAWSNSISRLPGSIGDLHSLEDLNLSHNALTELPRSIRRLTRLTDLDLDHNRGLGAPEWLEDLQALRILGIDHSAFEPEILARLANLRDLNIWGGADDTPPVTLPESVGRLRQLTSLSIVGFRAPLTIPPAIGELRNLTSLSISHNHQLAEIPDSVGDLSRLRYLSLRENKILSSLPNSLGRLTELRRLDVADNEKLEFPPAAVQAQGLQAMLAFLRAAHGPTESTSITPTTRRLWQSKLMIVGQGEVGKTTLYKALAGLPVSTDEPPTHGLNIGDLTLSHPEDSARTMRLSVWDFGGQDIYHATHQFFLTDQSLFVVAWNARTGWDHGRGEYWLDLIKARVPDATVVVVATHSDGSQPANFPRTRLAADHPNIAAFLEVDSIASVGIDALRNELTTQAARLPLMGARWPSSWLDAIKACRDHPANQITPKELDDLLLGAGIDDADSRAEVPRVLNALGEILYYGDGPADSARRSVVVLKPAWLSERIAAILDCAPVRDRGGLLLAEDVAREWNGLGDDMRALLVAMMDQYGVCYRVVDESGHAVAVVVGWLPHEPPDFRADWARLAPPNTREMRLRYAVAGNIPPGIPGWFIARAHRLASPQHRPWLDGALFAHPDGEHLGLLQLDRHSRTIELAVRGPHPAGFLGLLDLDFVEATQRRYPGLQVTRSVPCPCEPGCASSWPYTRLIERERRGRTTVECGVSLQDIPIALLLDGVGPGLTLAGDAAQISGSLQRLESFVQQILGMVSEQGSLHQEQAELLHLRFAQLMSWMQVTTPTVFTLVEKPRYVPGVHRYRLRLYCAEPNAMHQLPEDKGCYDVTVLAEWTGALARRLAVVASLLASVTGLAGTIMGIAAPDLLARGEKDLTKVRSYLEKVKSVAGSAAGRLTDGDVPLAGIASEADTRVIDELLHGLRKEDNWGGLCKTLTAEGSVLYLCEDHAKAREAGSPLPRGLRP